MITVTLKHLPRSGRGPAVLRRALAEPGGERGDAATCTGFANHHATEAVAGALPVGRNSPQHVPFGLYAEQLSGTAFTAPRAENRRSWLYRLRPTANHGAFRPMPADR